MKRPRITVVCQTFLTVASVALLLSTGAEHARVYASGLIAQAYNLIQDEGTPVARATTINCVGLGITCTQQGNVTQFNVPAASATQQHTITFVVSGGGVPISTGGVGSFPTAAFACTINRIDTSADVSGSVTIDIWKRAGAIPTAANIISASAPATLTASQLNQSGSLTGWTTTVASGDVFGASVASVSGVSKVTVQIWCQ